MKTPSLNTWVARTEKVTLSNKNENLARKESKATPIPTITEIIMVIITIIRKEKINQKGGLELAQSRSQKNSNQPIRTQRLFSFNATTRTPICTWNNTPRRGVIGARARSVLALWTTNSDGCKLIGILKPWTSLCCNIVKLIKLCFIKRVWIVKLQGGLEIQRHNGWLLFVAIIIINIALLVFF